MKNVENGVIELSDWQSIVSGNAHLHLTSVSNSRGTTLRMDYDFKGGGGFVVARRAVQRTMPADYAVNFRLRGTGAVNNLEIKLVDATGQNVWRRVMQQLAPPHRWKRFTVRSQDIDFAWGPLGSGTITTLGSVEVAIVAGAGGTGTLWLSDLQIENRTPTAPPRLTASSAVPPLVADEAHEVGWQPLPGDARPWILIDWTQPRTIGGLVIDWLERAPAGGFEIAASSTGNRWKVLHKSATAGGRRSYVSLPDLRTRFLRLKLHGPSAGAKLRIQSFEFSRSVAAFWNSIAAGEMRGWHPRWVHREQSLWTPFGAAHATHCALLNDDGMAEPGLGSFSLEPMLWIDGRLVTWADIDARQQLPDGWLPVPSVAWQRPDWQLTVTADTSGSGVARVHYRVANLTARQCSARLFVLLRPFQVTPPWQSFRKLGGMSPIHTLDWRNGEVLVNGTMRLALHAAGPARQTPRFAALAFADGFMPEHLTSGELPATSRITDPSGFATGVVCFDLRLDPHQTAESSIAYLDAGDAGAGVYHADEAAFDWRSHLAAGQFRAHDWGADVIAAALTATAQVLITRDGPALQPGPRRYTRTWIRDAAMMCAALLRMGHNAEVRDFIRWYAPFQRADGFVPCCVDREGVDWLVEHDSHGELLVLVADYVSFTADEDLLREVWGHIQKALDFIESALGSDGLMPISVSHEGYLAQPVHSYWDDFWTMRGLRDAAGLARLMGDSQTAQRCHDLFAHLSSCVFVSIEATRAQRHLDFIPGSIEWADFDPTATANALYLLDVPGGLNRAAVERTFDKYLADWRAKRSGAVTWTNYTPYEIRNIGAFVRLGQRAAALELLRFFLADRRPSAWNQWPEIAWREQRTPAHMGDLPHTWIAAEYVLAVRSLFAYELESQADATMIVAAGVAAEWLYGDGVRVDAMPTRFGPLSYALRRLDACTLRFEVSGGFAGIIVLRAPLAAPLLRVTVDGEQITSFDAASVTLPQNNARMPVEVICITSASR